MMTDFDSKVLFREMFKSQYTVVYKDWYRVIIEATCLTNTVNTFFFYNTGGKISGQRYSRKYYRDSKGTYIRFLGSKVYFSFDGK